MTACGDQLYNCFLANVNSRSRSLFAIARSSACRLSVCNVCPPFSGYLNFEKLKWCKTGSKLLSITNRKSRMSFRLVPKSVT